MKVTVCAGIQNSGTVLSRVKEQEPKAEPVAAEAFAAEVEPFIAALVDCHKSRAE